MGSGRGGRTAGMTERGASVVAVFRFCQFALLRRSCTCTTGFSSEVPVFANTVEKRERRNKREKESAVFSLKILPQRPRDTEVARLNAKAWNTGP
jgi:hypothetical protein